jgi:t-SNARE complex subunit (syntaxin)
LGQVRPAGAQDIDSDNMGQPERKIPHNDNLLVSPAKGYQAEAVRQMLEKGIIAYKERYKKYPDNALQMIEARFIQLPEGFLDHFTVTINKRNGEFSVIAK